MLGTSYCKVCGAFKLAQNPTQRLTNILWLPTQSEATNSSIPVWCEAVHRMTVKLFERLPIKAGYVFNDITIPSKLQPVGIFASPWVQYSKENIEPSSFALELFTGCFNFSAAPWAKVQKHACGQRFYKRSNRCPCTLVCTLRCNSLHQPESEGLPGGKTRLPFAAHRGLQMYNILQADPEADPASLRSERGKHQVHPRRSTVITTFKGKMVFY
jgi:hypothetical protein